MNAAFSLLTITALTGMLSCGGSQPAPPATPAPTPPRPVAAPAKAKPTAPPAEPETIDPEILAELVDEDEYLLGGVVGGVVGGVPGGVVGGVIGGVLWDVEEQTPAPEPPPPPKPASVPPATLLAYRVAGGTVVAPSAKERRRILRSKAGRASATIELCLSAQAEITRTAVVEPSGYLAWESALMESMWEWRFRPFDASGEATAICSHLLFTYPELESAQP